MTCDPVLNLRVVLAIVVLAGIAVAAAIALLVVVGDNRREARRDAMERRRGAGSSPQTARPAGGRVAP